VILPKREVAGFELTVKTTAFRDIVIHPVVTHHPDDGGSKHL
jgi:hypothetical protein